MSEVTDKIEEVLTHGSSRSRKVKTALGKRLSNFHRGMIQKEANWVSKHDSILTDSMEILRSKVR
jgi:hypothetical protein